MFVGHREWVEQQLQEVSGSSHMNDHSNDRSSSHMSASTSAAASRWAVKKSPCYHTDSALHHHLLCFNPIAECIARLGGNHG